MAKKEKIKIVIVNKKGYGKEDEKKKHQCYYKQNLVKAGDSFEVDADEQDAKILLALGYAEVVKGKPTVSVE